MAKTRKYKGETEGVGIRDFMKIKKCIEPRCANQLYAAKLCKFHYYNRKSQERKSIY